MTRNEKMTRNETTQAFRAFADKNVKMMFYIVLMGVAVAAAVYSASNYDALIQVAKAPRSILDEMGRRRYGVQMLSKPIKYPAPSIPFGGLLAVPQLAAAEQIVAAYVGAPLSMQAAVVRRSGMYAILTHAGVCLAVVFGLYLIHNTLVRFIFQNLEGSPYELCEINARPKDRRLPGRDKAAQAAFDEKLDKEIKRKVGDAWDQYGKNEWATFRPGGQLFSAASVAYIAVLTAALCLAGFMCQYGIYKHIDATNHVQIDRSVDAADVGIVNGVLFSQQMRSKACRYKQLGMPFDAFMDEVWSAVHKRIGDVDELIFLQSLFDKMNRIYPNITLVRNWNNTAVCQEIETASRAELVATIASHLASANGALTWYATVYRRVVLGEIAVCVVITALMIMVLIACAPKTHTIWKPVLFQQNQNQVNQINSDTPPQIKPWTIKFLNPDSNRVERRLQIFYVIKNRRLGMARNACVGVAMAVLVTMLVIRVRQHVEFYFEAVLEGDVSQIDRQFAQILRMVEWVFLFAPRYAASLSSQSFYYILDRIFWTIVGRLIAAAAVV